jgi:isopentenyl-diphosphate delta-isomerase
LPEPNAAEVKDWKYISLQNLQEEIALHPENFSAWLKISLPRIITEKEGLTK